MIELEKSAAFRRTENDGETPIVDWEDVHDKKIDERKWKVMPNTWMCVPVNSPN